jgi:hypothetical protein
MKCVPFVLAALLLSPALAAPVDDTTLSMSAAGDYALRVVSPEVLEVVLISAAKPDSSPGRPDEDFHAADFAVEQDGSPVAVAAVGTKRRALYAPLKLWDLRVSTSVYLELATPLPNSGVHHVSVQSRNPHWPANVTMTATTDPLRYSPAIHVNQEGYVPELPKLAMVGYYLGTLGELSVPADAGFDIVDARTHERVFHGDLMLRRDTGFNALPAPYQRVYQADFTKLRTPGEYLLVVPGLGASLPFRVDEGELMNVTRAYALGLYHQRCGTALELPFTRFTHDACHTAPAEVPIPASDYPKAWEIIRKLDEDRVKAAHPEFQLKYADQQLYPFVRTGRVDVHGGHHDAGDYSKYTTNSAQLIHILIFGVDSLPGVAELDNLGLPESGDGISDVLEEAKWESDYIARLQDEDGGFYFLVYPRERRYENDVLPDHGDPQIVWPKTTASTAAAVAALAQCASSPAFKRHYPDVAKQYLEKAELGWRFLTRAIAKHGLERSYQRLTHYGDEFNHNDELAWAACELFVATGDRQYEQKLFEWFPDPADPATREYGWRRASAAYGNAMRSYAFASSSGRLQRNQLDLRYVAKCEAELRRAGEDALRWAQDSAYGISYPEASKRIGAAAWFFPSDQAFDMTVADQLVRRPVYADAVLSNLNYEVGCNPLNRCYVTGLGVRRQREIVHQYAQNDDRVLPPSGIPLGSVQSQFSYLGQYQTRLRDLSWPHDDGSGPVYPIYDRWTDTYNLSTEFVVVNQARSLVSLACWAARTKLKTQPWKAAGAKIVGPTGTVPLYQPATYQLECQDLDLTNARIVWEAHDQEPAFGRTYTITPRTAGAQWVEAEAALPDGRRVFAHLDFRADASVVLWVDGALPRGAQPTAQGGDNWDWIKAASKPPELASHRSVPQHESALAHGIHEHGFHDAAESLAVSPGDILFAYIFIDPRNIPQTIMLEWNDGSTDHRAFWGKNMIPYGRINTASQHPMGPLPPAGRWVRLEVPASAVGLEGRTVTGLVFRLYDGRVRWDAVGKMTPQARQPGAFHVPAAETSSS